MMVVKKVVYDRRWKRKEPSCPYLPNVFLNLSNLKIKRNCQYSKNVFVVFLVDLKIKK